MTAKVLKPVNPEKAAQGGIAASLVSFFLSLITDHWVEFSTLVISAIGIVWAVKNYRANIAVKNLEAEKLRIEIESMQANIRTKPSE